MKCLAGDTDKETTQVWFSEPALCRLSLSVSSWLFQYEAYLHPISSIEQNTNHKWVEKHEDLQHVRHHVRSSEAARWGRVQFAGASAYSFSRSSGHVGSASSESFPIWPGANADLFPSMWSAGYVSDDLVSRRQKIAKKQAPWTKMSTRYWVVLPENNPKYWKLKHVGSKGPLVRPPHLSEILESLNYWSSNYWSAAALQPPISCPPPPKKDVTLTCSLNEISLLNDH